MLNLANNNFKGTIPDVFPSGCQLKALDLHGNFIEGEIPKSLANCSELEVLDLGHNELIVTVTTKGQEMELPKILTIFTYIDLSRNNFHGLIPAELGQLQALYILNLSCNALTGQIPPSLGNLKNLESLDLSWNNLRGRIPTQLQSLNFLSFLSLSFNQLVGMIPTGNQLQTFSADSHIGNEGLSGFLLTKNCSDKVADPKEDNHSNSGRKIDWTLLIAEIGLLTGIAVVVLPLVFSRRWRIRYYKCVDDIIIEIFPLAVSRKWFLWTAI
ncbi:hypothetical protein TIFTF001_028241 [Ficus carica]|uniref:Uncharacterized protein n=1 Tax=Ficus carica TaxID=3494 RepID=A0AA88IW98_FICCA|nr:hypothetical protein TIFTF001_028241 [Ficus carica]